MVKRTTKSASLNGSAMQLPSTITIEMTVHDSEVIRAISKQQSGAERDQYITSALQLGVIAIETMSGELDTIRIQTEVNRMLDGLKTGLENHTQRMDEKLESALKVHFDPKSGQLPIRLEQLVKEGGEIDSLLRSMVGDDQSELVKTLTAHVGQKSPLLKILDPDQSKGLLASITKTLEETLTAQEESVLAEFSLDNKEGALKRFITELEESQGELTTGLEEQIDGLVEEFSFDNDESALNRLMRSVQNAQRTITSEFSLDSKDSALSRLRKELTEQFEEQNLAASEFREDVEKTLAVLSATKEERQKGTRHGDDFEAAVLSQVKSISQGSDDKVQATGNRTGAIKNCKKGDAVVQLGPEHIAAGANIVIEAKQKRGYDIDAAQAEIVEARKNRRAQIGIFVFSASHAPDGMESFKRVGDDIFVVWDSLDPSTDVNISAAMSVAKALCTKKNSSDLSDDFDLDVIEQAILEIERRTNGLTDISRWTETISNNADKIINQVQTTRKSIRKQIALLNTQVEFIQTLGG